MVDCIGATSEALALMALLEIRHGPLVLRHDEGDGAQASLICSARGGFRAESTDVLLGEVGGVPVYMNRLQLAGWQYADLIIAVAKGRSVAGSLEGAEGVRFFTRARAADKRLSAATPATAA